MDSLLVVLLGGGFAFALWYELRDRVRREQTARSNADLRAFADAEAEIDLQDAVQKLLAMYVVAHESALLTKRRQTIFADDYGVEDRSLWQQEVRYFVDRVCDPAILNYYSDGYHLTDTSYILIALDIDKLLDAGGGTALPATYQSDMTGVQFERLVAERLTNVGAEVRFTPVTGDQGADLIVYHNGETIVVQCKRSASTVGNKAVQEAYAGRKFHDAAHAWVVSDAPFSRSARQLAASLSVRLIDLNQVEAAL